VRRRDFITLLSGVAAAWPVAARAQQQAMPSIGFLNAASPQGYARPLAAFVKGLNESGYVEGHNVAIEYRWSEGQIDLLQAMAAELVTRQVSVIAATTTAAALAAKRATTSIPIVFETSSDPIQLGLVTSLNRPGGNVTGVTQSNVETAPKRLELLHELLPSTTVIALLVNPANPSISDPQVSGVLSAARTLKREVRVLNASNKSEFDEVFPRLHQLGVGGLVIGTDPFFTSLSEQLAALAIQHAMPAVYSWREFVAAGGLLSYGAAVTDAYYLAGQYAGRILKGDKPADLPVQQSTKVELYINLRTAKVLGINLSAPLLGRADELIE
jgi:putative ABC transport system substrate-binding protein